MMKKYFMFTIAIFLILAFTVMFHSVGYSSDDAANPTPVSGAPADESARRGTGYINNFVEPYMNPMNLYFEREKFHAENGKKYFVEFIEQENQLIFDYRYLSEAFEEYMRRWEEQKILARLGLPERKLTDEDVLLSFYTGEAHTVFYMLDKRRGSIQQTKRDRWQARLITLRYWGIPYSTPANKWRDYIDYHEQALLKEITKERDALCNPNHVAMLCFVSFFMNDEGATDDAFYYCMVALTSNYYQGVFRLETIVSDRFGDTFNDVLPYRYTRVFRMLLEL